jgi:hypothetical protein
MEFIVAAKGGIRALEHADGRWVVRRGRYERRHTNQS